MSFLLYKNNIFVFFLSILFLLEGCGGPGTTAARIYEDTFSKKDQVECPDIKLIKELNNYYSRGQNEEVNYVVNLDKVSFECYLEYEESSDKSFRRFDCYIQAFSSRTLVDTCQLFHRHMCLLNTG